MCSHCELRSQLEIDLRAIRDRVASGWVKFHLFTDVRGTPIDNNEGLANPHLVKRVCISGAIHLAVRDEDPHRQHRRREAVTSALLHAIAETVGHASDGGPYSIPSYNDRDRTTQASVLMLLDWCIDRARAGAVAERETVWLDPIAVLAMANPPHDPEHTKLDVLVPPVVSALIAA